MDCSGTLPTFAFFCVIYLKHTLFTTLFYVICDFIELNVLVSVLRENNFDNYAI